MSFFLSFTANSTPAVAQAWPTATQGVAWGIEMETLRKSPITQLWGHQGQNLDSAYPSNCADLDVLDAGSNSNYRRGRYRPPIPVPR